MEYISHIVRNNFPNILALDITLSMTEAVATGVGAGSFLEGRSQKAVKARFAQDAPVSGRET
jgi:hypothetical protein